MLSKVKGVAIELKFGSHTKRFHLPRTSSSVDDFLRQVQTTFGFSGTIIGFKDPNGKISDYSEVFIFFSHPRVF